MAETPTRSPQVGEAVVDPNAADSDSNRLPEAPKANGAAGHKRTYQACIPCRQRKVKCDLGSVDAPGDPPCMRCRREKKQCTFSETRRKRKADEDGSPDDLVDETTSHIHKRLSTAHNGDGFTDYPVLDSPVLALPRNHGLVLEGAKKNGSNRPVKNEAAASLFHEAITEPSQALHMLINAVSQAEHDDSDAAKTSSAGHLPSQGQDQKLPQLGAQAIASAMQAIDPDLTNNTSLDNIKAEPGYTAATETWSRLRFVRAGWFTPEEGMAYVQYFYTHLSPLSPVLPPDYSSFENQSRLLNDEPMLLVTILTIASRYMQLRGAGGKSRSFWMHDKLWDYLQSTITRMFWGQEQFGGGFCGAGNASPQDADAQRRGLRTLGTVESLLLLSDWLPRSMHFPPGNDGDELLAPLDGRVGPPSSIGPTSSHLSWTEPAIRSDRMCWSLVSMAYSLAFELGVFDSLIEHREWRVGVQAKTSYDSERADRIGRMLFVYVTQACGRLGYPNMMPHQGTEANLGFLRMAVGPNDYIGPYEDRVTPTDQIQRAWAELTSLVRESNTELFESKRRVEYSVESGQYLAYVEKFGEKLRAWKRRFDQAEVPEKARRMILMEYHYARIFINSLSLQAVLEHIRSGVNNEDPKESHTAHTPPGLVPSKSVDFKKQNEPHIKEVVDASRSILEGARQLSANGELRHAPVRTHFRLLAAAMFLLKTFALGGKEGDVKESVDLLIKTSRDLRIAVPDDTHLSLRIAELLFSLTSSVKRRFIRLNVPGKGRSGAKGRPSTSHASAATTNGNNAAHHQGKPTIPLSGHHRRQDSLNSPMGGFFPNIPTANPNDPNITIMPPADFLNQAAGYDHSFFSAASPANSSGGVYSPTASHAKVASGSSPTVTATSPAALAQGGRPRHGSQAQAHPFSPAASSASVAGYDWLTLDVNPYLQSNGGALQAGSGNGNGGNGIQGGQGGFNSSNGGAFGPEISEGLDWLHNLGAVGNLGWDENAGGGTGGAGGWGS